MKYLTIIIAVFLLFGVTQEGVCSHKKHHSSHVSSKGKKRDYLKEKMKGSCNKSCKKSSKKKKHHKKVTKEVPKKEEKKKDDKKKDKEKSSKKDEKKKDDKKEEKKKEEKSSGKKEKKKSSEKSERPRMVFLPPPVQKIEPVYLTKEQNEKIDASVQQGNIDEAMQYYRKTGATLNISDKNGADQLECEGISKGAADIQVLRYLEGKKDKKPFTVLADDAQNLDHFIQTHCEKTWVTHQDKKVEVSFKGDVMAQASKHYTSEISLEQMICMRALNGKKTAIRFHLERDGKIAASFKERTDAEKLAAYINGEVVEESGYTVYLEEVMCKRLVPFDGKGINYYDKIVVSLQMKDSKDIIC